MSKLLTVVIQILALSMAPDAFASKKAKMATPACPELMSELETISVPKASNFSSEGRPYVTKTFAPQDDVTSELPPEVEPIINVATKRMARRAWSADFLKERLDIAKRFWPRSEVRAVVSGSPQQAATDSDKYPGTIALTYAKYDKLTSSETLPQDEVFEDLPRPIDRQGRGIIIELRAFSIDETSPDRVAIYNHLLNSALEMVFSRIKDYPELYDEPIIYTYGDALSYRYYHPLGFEKIQNMPTEDYKDGKWDAFAVTPRRFEENILKLRRKPGYLSPFKEIYKIVGVNHAHQVEVWDGRMFTPDKKSPIYMSLWGRAVSLILPDVEEIAPGIISQVGSELNTTLGIYLTKIGEPAYFKLFNILVPKNSSVQFVPDGSITKAFALGEDVSIPLLGVTVAKDGFLFQGDIIMTDKTAPREMRYVGVDPLSCETEVLPGLFAAKGSSIYWVRKKGSENDPWKLREVSKISRPYRLPSGEEIKIGESVYISHHGSVQKKNKENPDFRADLIM